MTGFTVPASVHIGRDRAGGLVVLNHETGRWHLLNSSGALLFEELRRSGDLAAAVRQLARRHPAVAVERLTADADALVAALVRRGLLDLPGVQPRGGAGVLMAVAPRQAPRTGVITRIAFVGALVLLRLPFRTCTAVVARIKRRAVLGDAPPAEVAEWLAAAGHVSRWYPGRVACLELSLTTVLSGALRRKRVEWCFGFREDPHTFHAWVETGGQPVLDVDDDPIASTYRRVFAV
jgi:hypothetical protein